MPTARKVADDTEKPKITKALPVMKWVETFRDHLSRCVGVRNFPLACVFRPEVGVPGEIPPLESS